MAQGSYLAREGAILNLLIPLLYPSIWAKRFVDTLEIIAWLVVFSFDLLAAVEIDIVLPAVPSLVLVGESSVEGCSLYLILSLF